MEIKKILVVDDAADLRALIALSLRAMGGWQVVVAASGAEALVLAATERPDLILLDLSMPDMDGMETLKRLRDDPGMRSVPVVFLTATRELHASDAYALAGAAGVISKPFNPRTLPQQIRDIANAPGGQP